VARSKETWALLLALGSSSLGPGCTKENPTPPTVSSEEELLKDDRRELELIVAQDLRASKAMTEADAATRRGDTAAALDALDQRAKPAIETGLRIAHDRPEMKTAWGQERQSTFVKILEDRRAELDPYREAVKSGDITKLIAAIESQAKIERRAIVAVGASIDASQ
jgi:hypothetical protein